MRKATRGILPFLLAFFLLAPGGAVAMTEAEMNSVWRDLPDLNLRMKIPMGWDGQLFERERGLIQVFIEPDWDPDLATGLFLIPADHAPEGSIAGFYGEAKDLSEGAPVEAWPEDQPPIPGLSDGIRLMKMDGMRARIKPDGHGWLYAILLDADRYIIYMYPDPAETDDPQYKEDIQIISQNITLLENNHPYGDDEAHFTAGPWGEGVQITGYTGNVKRLRVPDVLEGKPVMAIGEGAFYELAVEAVALPDTVAEIGPNAFSGCGRLRHVEFSKSLERIGAGAFESCFDLYGVELPATVKEIGSSAFWGCFALSSIALPASLELLGDTAFTLCNALMEIRVPEENGHFISQDGVLFSKDMKTLVYFPMGCPVEEGAYMVPEGVENIVAGAFLDIRTIETLTLPGTMTTLGEMSLPLAGLKSLTIPASIVDIDKNAYTGAAEGIVIHGQPGSAAEAFAQGRQIGFEPVETTGH